MSQLENRSSLSFICKTCGSFALAVYENDEVRSLGCTNPECENSIPEVLVDQTRPTWAKEAPRPWVFLEKGVRVNTDVEGHLALGGAPDWLVIESASDVVAADLAENPLRLKGQPKTSATLSMGQHRSDPSGTQEHGPGYLRFSLNIEGHIPDKINDNLRQALLVLRAVFTDITEDVPVEDSEAGL